MQYGLMGNYSVPLGQDETVSMSAAEVQQLLRRHGQCINVDGIYGSRTHAAMEAVISGAVSYRRATRTVQMSALDAALLRRAPAEDRCPGAPTRRVPGVPGKPTPGDTIAAMLPEGELREAVGGVPWWVWLIVAGAGGVALFTAVTAVRRKRRKPKRVARRGARR